MFNRKKMHPLEEKIEECIKQNDQNGLKSCISQIKEWKDLPLPSIDAQDSNGASFLMKAAARKNIPIVNLLLENKAATHLTNKSGLTVLDIVNQFALTWAHMQTALQNPPLFTEKNATDYITLLEILLKVNAEAPNISNMIQKSEEMNSLMIKESSNFQHCVELLQKQHKSHKSAISLTK